MSSAAPQPPPGFTLSTATEADLERINTLVRSFELAVEGRAENTVAGLRGEWAVGDRLRGLWVVDDAAGRAGAYAALTLDGETYMGDGFVDPDYWGRGLGGYLLDLYEHTAAATGERDILRTGISMSDEGAHRLVLAHGYREVRRFWSMHVEMTEPPVRREPPPGIEIALVPDDRFREFHDVLEQSFATHWSWRSETFDEWSARKAEKPAGVPRLWFWATRDNVPIAIVETSYREGGGWINTLGVLPDARGQVLGEALLSLALGEFFSRDTRAVWLGVDAENHTGATRLYEKLGFTVEHVYGIFERSL